MGNSPPAAGSDVASSAGSFATKMRKRFPLVQPDGDAMSSVSEQMPPQSLGVKARWEWKLKQLNYSEALQGERKFGRERHTAGTYARDAEAAGDEKMAKSLRSRAMRHELCESLGLGGILTRPDYAALKSDITNLKDFVEVWPVNAQQMLCKRYVQELCSAPGAITDQWDVFLDAVACWPLPTDTPNSTFDPLLPKLRLIDGEATAKTDFFLELFSEYAIGPVIPERLRRRARAS